MDAVRGVAVLCMIQWHCADAWLHTAIRGEPAFERLRIVGGLAAPLFLFLAGVSSGLTHRAGTLAAGIRRGATIAVWGYALKAFGWVVDHGAILERRNWLTLGLVTAALGLGHFGLAERRTPRERWLALTGAVAATIGAWTESASASCSPQVLARLDVLQGIGAALIVTALVLALAERLPRPALVTALAGLSVSLATPSFLGADLSLVPTPLLDYLARTVSDPSASGARFPLFPWLGYALVGAAVGLAAAKRPSEDAWALPFTRRPWLTLAAALALAACAFEPSWTAQAVLWLGEQPRNLLRLTFNVSLATAIAAVSTRTLPHAKRLADALLSLGRHSLVVYCVHLELAYGVVSLPLHHELSPLVWLAAVSALVLAMVALSYGLDARAKGLRRPAR